MRLGKKFRRDDLRKAVLSRRKNFHDDACRGRNFRARQTLRLNRPRKLLKGLTDGEFNVTLSADNEKISAVTICARLSYPDEKIFTATLAEAATSELVKHCVLIVRENC